MVRELSDGGTERQLTEIARSLDRKLFTPYVGAFRPYGPRAEDLREAGVPVLEIPVPSFRPGSVWRGARSFGRIVAARGIHLVHTFDYPAGLFGVPAARWYRVPCVISSQRSFRSLRTPNVRRLLRLTDRWSDRVVVNCRALEQDLVEREGVPPARVALCYNGVDTARFSPTPRASLEPLSGASLVVGTVGVLRPEKGFHLLLEAFAQATLPPDARLVIVGDGPQRAALQSQASKLGIASRCLLQPATRDVATWLRAIGVFVLPSLSEAFSNALLEAMACGCAPVASDAGGNPELVEDGSTGLLFPVGSSSQLAACLSRLAADPGLRQRLAHAAAARAATDFSLSAAATRMGEIYAGLLTEKLA
jgi:glycosyltransferase involved in cell wall biosynthesis